MSTHIVVKSDLSCITLLYDLGWPGNSLDLNPVENLWDKTKNVVVEKQPSTQKALINTIKEVWVIEFLTNYCSSLIPSMPRQLKVVIIVQGGHTKY